jgi:hypothetical protein
MNRAILANRKTKQNKKNQNKNYQLLSIAGRKYNFSLKTEEVNYDSYISS